MPFDVDYEFKICKNLLPMALLFLLLFSSLSVCILATGTDKGSLLENVVYVKSETELRDAVKVVGRSTVIALTKDIYLTDATLNISTGVDVTLTSKGDSFFKLIGASGNVAIGYSTIAIERGGSLTLDGIIVTHTPGVIGKGVFIDLKGKLVMNSGEISGNNQAYASGGGVQNLGTFIMFGGEISNNTAECLGGGVSNGGVGTFEMHNGKITNNIANSGGGVDNDNTFIMFGGVISSNNAQEGGGGVCNSFGTFSMLGGEITNNRATDGGGVYIQSCDDVVINGIVSDNVALNNGGGVWVTNSNNEADFNKLSVTKNAVFSNNHASTPTYDRFSVHNKVYTKQIKGTHWTYPFKQGYNNYDISYPQNNVIEDRPNENMTNSLVQLSILTYKMSIVFFIMLILGPVMGGLIGAYLSAKKTFKKSKTATTSRLDRTSFCSNCGTPITPNTRFCTKCGK